MDGGAHTIQLKFTGKRPINPQPSFPSLLTLCDPSLQMRGKGRLDGSSFEGSENKERSFSSHSFEVVDGGLIQVGKQRREGVLIGREGGSASA